MAIDIASLRIIKYPDPRLRKPCDPVTEFDDELRALTTRMLELMKAAPGVGLAAPQVGLLKRVFVCNTTGEAADDRVFVNPEIRDVDGWKEAEEGCLSIPEVFVQVRRSLRCTVVGQDLEGRPIELSGEDLPARVWQHEMDHLNGTLILDRMGPSDRIATRKKLRELEENYQAGR